MEKHYILRHLFAGTVLLAALSAHGQLINGNFATGDFTGWTQLNTPNGTNSLAQVTQFDITGTGVPVNCAEFEVGNITGSSDAGAGIYQDVTLGAGQINISLDIAATTPVNAGNYDAGTFELLLNGTVVASDSLGEIAANQTIRSSLDYEGSISAGTDQIEIEMLRTYVSVDSYTPLQYLSDIQLSVTPAPEPSSVVICGAALLTLFLFRRRVPQTIQ
jgi:hypothetical protein